jgi:hypothetical protein
VREEARRKVQTYSWKYLKKRSSDKFVCFYIIFFFFFLFYLRKTYISLWKDYFLKHAEKSDKDIEKEKTEEMEKIIDYSLEKIIERRNKGEKEKLIKDSDKKNNGKSIFDFEKGDDFLISDEEVLVLRESKIIEYIQYSSPLRALELIYSVLYIFFVNIMFFQLFCFFY